MEDTPLEPKEGAPVNTRTLSEQPQTATEYQPQTQQVPDQPPSPETPTTETRPPQAASQDVPPAQGVPPTGGVPPTEGVPPTQALPEENGSGVSERRRWVAGIVLVILGLFFLAQQFFGDFWSWAKWWPLILIIIGLFILVRSRRP